MSAGSAPVQREHETAVLVCVDVTGAERVPPRVLVADDAPDIRDLVCLAVRKAGGTVVAAVDDGLAALAAARDLAPDLAVLDVSMPGASGLEVCTALRTEAAATRVLLLSAGASDDDVARGLAAGADAYLAKPFSVAGLVAQIRTLTARQPA